MVFKKIFLSEQKHLCKSKCDMISQMCKHPKKLSHKISEYSSGYQNLRKPKKSRKVTTGCYVVIQLCLYGNKKLCVIAPFGDYS